MVLQSLEMTKSSTFTVHGTLKYFIVNMKYKGWPLKNNDSHFRAVTMNNYRCLRSAVCMHIYIYIYIYIPTHTYTHGSNSATQTSHEYAKDKSWPHDYDDTAVVS